MNVKNKQKVIDWCKEEGTTPESFFRLEEALTPAEEKSFSDKIRAYLRDKSEIFGFVLLVYSTIWLTMLCGFVSSWVVLAYLISSNFVFAAVITSLIGFIACGFFLATLVKGEMP